MKMLSLLVGVDLFIFYLYSIYILINYKFNLKSICFAKFLRNILLKYIKCLSIYIMTFQKFEYNSKYNIIFSRNIRFFLYDLNIKYKLIRKKKYIISKGLIEFYKKYVAEYLIIPRYWMIYFILN